LTEEAYSTSDSADPPANGSRLFICDPACVLPYGHTVSALNHFRRSFSGRFASTECVASLDLPRIVAHANDITRHFAYLYNEFIPVISAKEEVGVIERHPAYSPSLADPFEHIAVYDASSFVESRKMTSKDTILLPGADFYGVAGFVGALGALAPQSRPGLLIRLIGVFEHATSMRSNPERDLLRIIRRGYDLGLRISISAETPRYAAKLADCLEHPVEVTPYPKVSEIIPLPKSTTFNVLCAGSARLDKGFNHLLGIAKDLLLKPSERPIVITSQTLPVDKSEAWDGYTSQLYAAPNVTLFEPTISEQQMLELYRQCHVVLLPYAKDVYQFRGSAVMMEAASYGRLCVTLRGTAFAQQVEYYGLGSVVDDPGQISDELRRLASEDPIKQARRIEQARHRYFANVKSAYERWFNFAVEET
jgi:hypothetical protein